MLAPVTAPREALFPAVGPDGSKVTYRPGIGVNILNLIAGVTEGCEVQAGAGEEAVEQAGPVLHPPEPGLDQGGELGEVAFGQVGQGGVQQTGTVGLGDAFALVVRRRRAWWTR